MNRQVTNVSCSVYLGLVHYPIYNKRGAIVCTAITNFDIHDIARAARTYGLKRYFIIHPQESQAELAKKIVAYWQEGYGGTYNPDRSEALSILEVVQNIETAIAEIRDIEGQEPIVATTDAGIFPNNTSYTKLREKIETGNQPCLLLFGTGWGMEKSLVKQFDYILEPIYGPCDYNHLSVRAAVAIILDRLLGEAWWKS